MTRNVLEGPVSRNDPQTAPPHTENRGDTLSEGHRFELYSEEDEVVKG